MKEKFKKYWWVLPLCWVWGFVICTREPSASTEVKDSVAAEAIVKKEPEAEKKKELKQFEAELSVRKYVKNEYLQDRRSYDPLDFSQLSYNNINVKPYNKAEYMIWHSFRAKNKMGMDVYTKVGFFLDKKGNVMYHQVME